MGELEGTFIFVIFRPFRENSWAKNINRFLTFSLPRKPQNPPRKGESAPSNPPERRFPYCVNGYNKDVS